MKVVVQIPCLNEERTLGMVLKTIPKKIEGVDSIEILIIDDGSTDNTVALAKQHGVKHFVYHPQNQGLARSFHDGINRALELGADIVVNTDGDNQYPQERIADLVQPILQNKADIVIADRQVDNIKHFSPTKKLLQKFGTRVLNLAAGTRVPDAPSGFRAYSKEALIRLNIVTRFSYAMETIIQAGNKQLSIVSLPIRTNPKTRESRLFKSNWQHVRKSGMAIVRAFIMYKPYVLFTTLGLLLLVSGLVPFVRYLYFFLTEESRGAHHLQSLILGSVLLVASFIAFTLGIVADLIRINRVLIENSLEETKRARFSK
ncbi:MAG TPA: glycosyltransferase family 2 protein [Nevskiaceae bacterium]|nr:glycosyltransferase family 2 protein [Nevskiaceae bacterium]